MPRDTLTTEYHPSRASSRAARELGLKRSDFDLAVHLGRIRTVPGDGGGGRRVPLAEIERLRAQDGFPDRLHQRIRTVGTRQGAALMDLTPTRFTRLARLGVVVPVRFSINRYRAVVWRYMADELRHFATDRSNTSLLNGRMPEELRSKLADGADLRPRNWRGRHLGFLLRQADGPWQRAGAVAAFLDTARITEAVPDRVERAHLLRFRPGPPGHAAPGSPGAELSARLMTADDGEEIAWLRADLAQAVDEARGQQPAPRSPTRTDPAPRQVPHPAAAPAERPVPPCGLLRTGA
ncbi:MULTISPECIES: DUF6397 family protein [unclassified Streptomyces]|uniref:DUF6397 family protein n=1 Tax=unclassified Streptomyces TaxID=2593676 RepID=UPI001F03E805|nr:MULTISPECIES: DUF6397 family protein [unclassified Streptomyces]MCH0562453.1 hypothetical protein [Streptomyces sp. MUM 2J]MCH0570429.1 hypothetical protein [Streptomyces sp. MUM 136J]